MGRPSLGSGAKGVVGSVRLTEGEARALVSKYGSVSKGLRALVNRASGDVVAAREVTGRHLHRRGSLRTTDISNGTIKRTYNCAVEGCDAVLD